MDVVIKRSINNSMSYLEYKDLINNLLTQKKSTGSKQTETLLNYSKLNNARMKRLDKTIKLSDKVLSEVENNEKKLTWLVLTEGWCGDAAQTLPVINKIATSSENIDLKIVLRDDNEDLMNQFLTNGNKSIPKLIAIDNSSKKVIADWGPRPSITANMVSDYKSKHGNLDAHFKKELQVWYNKDKGQNTQEDIIKLLKAS